MVFMSIRIIPAERLRVLTFFACANRSNNVPVLSVVFTSCVAILCLSSGSYTSLYELCYWEDSDTRLIHV